MGHFEPMIENAIEPLRTKRQLAAFLQQTTRTVEKMMARGLPYIRLSARATRFRLADVQKWLADNCMVVRFGRATVKAGATVRIPAANS